MKETVPVIAVDGPSGVGKGTLCRSLAEALGFHLLDSGSLYRLTALAAARAGLRDDDAGGLAQVAATLDVRFDSGDILSGRVGSSQSGIVAVGSLFEAGGIGHISRARDLDRVLDQQPGALGTGDRTLDEQQTALDVRADDFEVLLRTLTVAHVAGHLLVLEHAARILAAAGGAVR
ncbi:MAG TPA: (d)CMP kinase, partial [Plasticicumulans sp.]|nr:(d)CMP kinase [Plasticicumulans sp.]